MCPPWGGARGDAGLEKAARSSSQRDVPLRRVRDRDLPGVLVEPHRLHGTVPYEAGTHLRLVPRGAPVLRLPAAPGGLGAGHAAAAREGEGEVPEIGPASQHRSLSPRRIYQEQRAEPQRIAAAAPADKRRTFHRSSPFSTNASTSPAAVSEPSGPAVGDLISGSTSYSPQQEASPYDSFNTYNTQIREIPPVRDAPDARDAPPSRADGRPPHAQPGRRFSRMALQTSIQLHCCPASNSNS